MDKQKAKLVLADGASIPATPSGISEALQGSGIQHRHERLSESLYRSLYRGQILIATFPLVGNYGVPEGITEGNLRRYWESDKSSNIGSGGIGVITRILAIGMPPKV
jgi:carbamoylphosphate synthase small subunit